MTKQFVVVHRQDENNVGDMASNPLQYFLQPDQYEVVDITKIRETNYTRGVPIIVGGGGLIGNDFFGDSIKDILESGDKLQLRQLWESRWELRNPANQDVFDNFTEKFHKLINDAIVNVVGNDVPKFLWGAGHNGEVQKKSRTRFEYPDYLADFKLVGVRDWNQNLKWVPCASCMHKALRKNYTIKNEVIWFEHKKQLVKDFGNEPIPRFINSGNNVEQTIELLGSANVIITNSYHGAYWGTLLKRKVIVVSPWSTKFLSMKHQPVLVEKVGDWREAAESAKIYDYALDESISATEKYWGEIRKAC